MNESIINDSRGARTRISQPLKMCSSIPLASVYNLINCFKLSRSRGGLERVTRKNIPMKAGYLCKEAIQNEKRIFSYLLIVTMAMLFVAGASAAEREPVEGEFQYIVVCDDAWVTGYYGHPRGKLTIPKKLGVYPVTAIDSFGLSMYDITSVTIPDGVTVIGGSAFYHCFCLADVTIPASVSSIGDGAFMGCIRLASVTIPDSVTGIGDEVFSDCCSLTDVTIPGRVTSIGFGAFFGCTSLTGVTIPDSVTSIGSMAFAMCGGLTSVTIPASVTVIGNRAFDAPNSVYPADESDDAEVVYGSGKLILSVEEGSYAEQYAKENGIRYVLALEVTADIAGELLVKQVDEFFTMTKAEIIEKLESDFTVVPAGPEGVCDGYYYEDLGIAFAFYPDSETLELIDCYPGFNIHDVGTGNLFSEILEALGDTEIVETWLELPIYTAFMVRYRLGNAEYSFIAFEEDAPVHILWICQTPYADSDGE